MDKIWAGRLKKPTAAATDAFNSSLPTDKRMYAEDIEGSIAHAEMLAKCAILSAADSKIIVEGLNGIKRDIASGTLPLDGAEDIHTFIEAELTSRIGEAGKRLHTARSRNDQVATDTRLYLARRITEIQNHLVHLTETLAHIAENHTTTVMPGYTHLQRAQPVSLGYHLTAYCAMLLRDLDRLKETKRRTLSLPLGACALAGTSYPIDRAATAAALGFESIAFNGMDAVSDRDFIAELAADLSLVMAHLSRLAEEIINWSSWEYRFVELDEAYSTGSSIMPQKKNPDIAELVRGKTGRVYGNLIGILTVIKGLPLAYNKDLQEDKDGIFDSVDTVTACLPIFADMLASAKFSPENMLAAAKNGYLNATDVADYLTRKGVPFRTAYKISGELVARAIELGKPLDALDISEYKKAHAEFDSDIYAAIDITECLKNRTSEGGPAPSRVAEQITLVRKMLGEYHAQD